MEGCHLYTSLLIPPKLQVNCLGGLCKPGHLEGTVDQPWLPDSPNQWWRVGLSLLYHHGIIELAIVVMAQLLLFIPVEHLAGWLRMAVIYVLSGTASLLVFLWGHICYISSYNVRKCSIAVTVWLVCLHQICFSSYCRIFLHILIKKSLE